MGAITVAVLAAMIVPQRARGQDAHTNTNDVPALVRIVNDPNADVKQRDEAARRLASRNTPEARDAISNAIQNLGNPAAQLSMANALAEVSKPDPALVDPLFALIGPGSGRELADAAARALANYKNRPEVLTRLINLAEAQTQHEWVRISVIKAIGTLVEKRAAAFLIDTIRSREENAAIINAAADALVSMTGLTENGRDLQRWERWWQENGQKPDDQFRNDLLASRVSAFDQLRARYAALSHEVANILGDTYQSAPENQKKELLLRYLRNPEPEIRAAGAELVYEDKIEARVVPPEIQDELRKMVGDSSPNVRLQVAKALGVLNDAAALGPLLAQLQQETEPDVRAAIAGALGPIRDLHAVQPLLQVVNDDAFAVARAAADSLKELGPQLRDANPNLAHQTAEQLLAVLQKTQGQVGAQELRESLVEAMAPLRQHDLMRPFIDLLKPNESVRVRRAALKGLGEIGDHKAADAIVPLLNDDQAGVRLEAVLALQKLATLENANALANVVDHDPDESVRNEAWKGFESLLPQMEAARLQEFADRFRKDLPHRQIILMQLAKTQQGNNDLDGLASTQENIGQNLRDQGDYKGAAAYFRQALSARENDTGTAKERLVEDLIDSLLRAKQYTDAASFAGEMIKKDTQYQQTMGPAFFAEAERLINDAHDPASAIDLIGAAEKVDPPLAPQYLKKLGEARQDAQKLADKNKGSSSAGNGLPNTTAGAE